MAGKTEFKIQKAAAGYAQQNVSGAGPVQRNAAGGRIGVALALIGGLDLGKADGESTSTVDSASMVTESGYNKEENTIDTQAYTSTILEESADAGESYINETLFLGDSNTARMYRMFDYCSYDNAIGSVGMSARNLATFACVQLSTSSSYVTMSQAVAKLQPRRVILLLAPTTSIPATKQRISHTFSGGHRDRCCGLPQRGYPRQLHPAHRAAALQPEPNPDQVDEYNKALVEMCQEKGWKFLNSAEVLKDAATGYAKSGYVETSDGIHLTRSAMDALFNYIRTHSYITEDDRPALTTIPKHTGAKDAVTYTVPVVSSTASTEEPVSSESEYIEDSSSSEENVNYVEATPTPEPVIEETPTPAPEATAEPTAEPAATPEPTVVSTEAPTATPEPTAVPEPTAEPAATEAPAAEQPAPA